jgi:peptide deformylase
VPAAPVLRYPNPLLKQRCRPVALESERDLLARVAADLVDTMRSHPHCVGLAAPQIGALVRLVAVDVTGHPKAESCHGLLVLANPAIARTEGDELGREGCLSVPDLTANVRRATLVEVEAVTAAGKPVSLTANGFEARVLQHELDHLDGILFLDRVASKQDLFRRQSYR